MHWALLVSESPGEKPGLGLGGCAEASQMFFCSRRDTAGVVWLPWEKWLLFFQQHSDEAE